MATLKFADTYNMVAFLSKPIESDGFEQIVDFLNAHPIRYALMINRTIYTSCIEPFWSTVKANTINGEEQLHALVDGKKIIITELSVRRDLQLADEEGVDCLPNSTIFEQLTLMGPKTTAWNEFSSTMASAIICLATNQKFNDSKFIFESMIRNLDNLSGKFLMYPSTLEGKRVQWGREKGSLSYEFNGDKRGDSDLTLVTWCLGNIAIPTVNKVLKLKRKENPFVSAHAKDLGDSSEPFAENLNHSAISSIAARASVVHRLVE
ncbi:hypothetical protein Tco_0252948 [Tanacetum coccineum]